MKSLLLLAAVLAIVPAVSQEENYPTPPEAIRKEGVPQGKLIKGSFSASRVFPGTERDYAVYFRSSMTARNPPR